MQILINSKVYVPEKAVQNTISVSRYPARGPLRFMSLMAMVWNIYYQSILVCLKFKLP